LTPRSLDTQSGTDPEVDDAEAHLGHLIREASRAYTRALQSRISRHGVTIGQWFFLCALWERDGMTQRELSQRVGMMEPTTVTALNGMERRGYITRVRNADDRRKVNIFLTPRGRELRDVLEPHARELHRRALAGMPAADAGSAVAAIRAVIANLSAD
jgi:DNA-binding MarR family transcriptional regulator